MNNSFYPLKQVTFSSFNKKQMVGLQLKNFDIIKFRCLLHTFLVSLQVWFPMYHLIRACKELPENQFKWICFMGGTNRRLRFKFKIRSYIFEIGEDLS